MTDNERRLWVEKCSELLTLALCEIRSLSWGGREAGRVSDLADITHNLPHFMVGRDDHAVAVLRNEFVRYARKHSPNADPAMNAYVYLIDMDETAFNEMYRTRHPWPEPAAAAVK